MPEVEEKLAQSLTAETIELLPFLPYLLQDLWSLGSDPEDIIRLLSRYQGDWSKTRVLDVACGKGAVAIHLAKTLGCQIKGIDLMPEFIHDAQKKAKEYKVKPYCQFTVGDMNHTLKQERDYDIVLLLGVDIDIVGTPLETLNLLKNTVKKGGWVVLDVVFEKDEQSKKSLSRAQWTEIFQQAGVKLLVEDIFPDDAMAAINKRDFNFIVQRAEELKKKYPSKADMFTKYVQDQQAECMTLEQELTCITWLLVRE